ncbi:MAG: transposase [Sedimenticola sp.]
MARLPRLIVPGLPHHIIQRGNNRSPVFFDESDYCAYLSWLYEAAKKHGCIIHSYVLMTNHVHLLLTPGTDNSVGNTLQTLGRRYVRYINGTYSRTGTLWEGRFKSSVIQTDRYLLTCYRYIELNPIRAGMVDHPGDYRWSSYRCNANGITDSLIKPHEEYLRLGSDNTERLHVYRSLFSSHIDPEEMQNIRASANRGTVLGSDRFKDLIEAQVKRRVRLYGLGGDRRSVAFLEGR